MTIKGKILIIDDDPDFILLMQKQLETHGHEVYTAINGPEALKILQVHAFDIVYTDLVMSEMDGIAICRKVKEIRPETEVVLVSAHAAEVVKNLLEFWRAGGRDEILRKPLGATELILVTEKLLQEIADNGRLVQKAA